MAKTTLGDLAWAVSCLEERVEVIEKDLDRTEGVLTRWIERTDAEHREQRRRIVAIEVAVAGLEQLDPGESENSRSAEEAASEPRHQPTGTRVECATHSRRGYVWLKVGDTYAAELTDEDAVQLGRQLHRLYPNNLMDAGESGNSPPGTKIQVQDWATGRGMYLRFWGGQPIPLTDEDADALQRKIYEVLSTRQ